MDYRDPQLLRDALIEQNLPVAMRCIRAGQNPIQLKSESSDIPFYIYAIAAAGISPEFLSFLALRNVINLDEASELDDGRSFLHTVFGYNNLHKLHLTIQAGADLSVLQGSSLLELTNYNEALMLLFAGFNPQHRKFLPESA